MIDTAQANLFGAGDSLLRERERLSRDRWENIGTHCKACDQRVKVYRRKLYDAQAIALMYLVILARDQEWVHVNELPILQGRLGGGDFAKLEHYGLIEAQPNEHPKAKRCSGFWRPTVRGIDFARGRVSVPVALFIYDGHVLGFDDSQTIGIREVLPEDFDYSDIWRTE